MALQSKTTGRYLAQRMGNVTSPCINVCRMHNNVCIGCYRTLEEIAKWTQYSDQEKIKVKQQLETRK